MGRATDGEFMLQEWFRRNNISFKREVPINGLKNDSKTYRIADFYLNDLKVYLEFAGQWNNKDPKHKARYRQKIAIYQKNNVPCIWIFPGNLSNMSYIFPKKLQDAHKQHNIQPSMFWRIVKYISKEKSVYATERYR